MDSDGKRRTRNRIIFKMIKKIKIQCNTDDDNDFEKRERGTRFRTVGRQCVFTTLRRRKIPETDTRDVRKAIYELKLYAARKPVGTIKSYELRDRIDVTRSFSQCFVRYYVPLQWSISNIFKRFLEIRFDQLPRRPLIKRNWFARQVAEPRSLSNRRTECDFICFVLYFFFFFKWERGAKS